MRIARITEAWREQREIRDVMVFLQSHGVSTTYAIKIYKLYGADGEMVDEGEGDELIAGRVAALPKDAHLVRVDCQ